MMENNMKFQIRNLSVLAFANGFTLWHYKTAKNELRYVSGPGFFNDASDMITTGDMMMISGPDGAKFVAMNVEDGNVTANSVI
jgi:hypothetical protein